MRAREEREGSRAPRRSVDVALSPFAQADLHQAITTCKKTEELNVQLASNFERVQGELVRTRKKFNDARSQLLEVDRTKVEADRATELAVQKWKAQLDQRSRELEEVSHRQVELGYQLPHLLLRQVLGKAVLLLLAIPHQLPVLQPERHRCGASAAALPRGY